MKLKVISAFCIGMLMVSCSSEGVEEIVKENVVEVSSELTEKLEAEKELNEQAHQLNDDLDQFMNDLEQ